jgi:16S rRNA (adenine1518-N6/adenine1519-N6)-dimethyltransferase
MKKNVLVISDGNGVNNNFLKWTGLLLLLCGKNIAVNNKSVIGASNELIMMQVAEAVSNDVVDAAIIQWTVPCRIDLVATEFWKDQAIQKLQVHESDALKFDFQAWAKEQKSLLQKNAPEARVKIVGNLPYNISSPLLFHLMSAVAEVDEQVFMLQAEVVERMVAQHGDSEYGRLSVMLQSKYHMENVLDVPPECFDPPPKVNSAIVKMIPRQDIHLTEKEYQSLGHVVSMAFAQRRKVLRNNLASVKDILKLSDDVLGLRAQDISVEDYIGWARQLIK